MHKVLIIGVGGIGQRHLSGYTETGRAIISIVEPDETRRNAAIGSFSIVSAFDDLAGADLSRFDLAVICAPAHVHLAIMTICANAGLPFMVEKPLAVTEDGVDEVLALVEARNLVARIGYIRRVAPEVQALRDQIRAGRIGDLKLVYVNASQEFPKYRPDFQSTYYARPEMGGGAILDAASHTFDLLIWMLGKPSHVGCMFDTMVLQGIDTEDTCLINIRFASGAMANITINQFQKPNTSRHEYIGTLGNLLLDHSTLTFSDNDDAQTAQSKDYMQGMAPMAAHQARFTLQANAMLDAIEGKPCHLATLEDARLNLRIALAAKRSWNEKMIISLGAADV